MNQSLSVERTRRSGNLLGGVGQLQSLDQVRSFAEAKKAQAIISGTPTGVYLQDFALPALRIRTTAQAARATSKYFFLTQSGRSEEFQGSASGLASAPAHPCYGVHALRRVQSRPTGEQRDFSSEPGFSHSGTRTTSYCRKVCRKQGCTSK